MKQFIQRNFYTLLSPILAIVFILGFSSENNAQETWQDWEAENYQAKYRTSGPNHPSQQSWFDIEWEKWESSGNTWSWQSSAPPPPAPGQHGANLAYIKISEGHNVVLEDALDYKNRLTLVICGQLEIGELIVSEVPDVNVQSITPNYFEGKFESFTITGSYFSNYPVADHNGGYNVVGFSIIAQGSNLDIFDPQHYIYINPFSADDAILDADNNVLYYSSLFTISELDHWLSEGSTNEFKTDEVYEIIAIAVNEKGFGYSSITSFEIDSSNNMVVLEAPMSEGGDSDPIVNTFNKLRVWICEDGSLTMDALVAKNSAEFHVYGTFYIEELDLGNNYCFTGTGSVLDSNGELPPINDGEWYNPCDEFFPIDLISFESEVNPEYIELTWVTATELNNDFFTLERSSDLYAWEIVGYVQGAGTTSEIQHYSYRDHSPREGISYYRLKQTDFDGQFEYFGPLSVIYMPGADGLDFRVARHPDQWTIFVPGEGAYHIELYDLTGRKIYSDMVVNNITIPAPGQTVVVRVFNDRNHSASRVVM